MAFNPWLSKQEKKEEPPPKKLRPRRLGNPPTQRDIAGQSYSERFVAGEQPIGEPEPTSFADQFEADAKRREETPSVAVQEPPDDIDEMIAEGKAIEQDHEEDVEPEAPAAEVAADPVEAEAEPEPEDAEPDTALFEALLAERKKHKPSDLPTFARRTDKEVRSNMRELSLIEGNMMRIDRELKTIYCTSCFDGEGKSTTAAHMAFALAELAKRDVLLLDVNCDSPKVHQKLRMSNDVGLAEVLAGKATLEEAITPTAYENLYALSAGNGSFTLHEKNFNKELNVLKRNFDFIIIDGKSVMVSSSPSNIAPLIDLFLLIVECESTKWEVVQMAHEKLNNVGAKYTAVSLNKRRFYVPRFVYRLLSKR